MSFLSKRASLLNEVIERTEFLKNGKQISSEEAFQQVYHSFDSIRRKQKKVFVIGNGGSAGIASHHVVDLINVLKVPTFSLSDNNLMTCMGNDYGYETIYAKPLEVLASEDDLLIAISSSGRSQNILDASEVMRSKNGEVITLTGFKESNPLRQLGHLNIWTPAEDYGLVESAHFIILHTLIDGANHYPQLSQLLKSKQKSLL